MNRDVKSKAILDAALEVFRHKSFHGATTKEVADAAGVSVGSLFRHFPNKEDLLMGLLSELVDSVIPKMFAESLDTVLESYWGDDLENTVKAFIHHRLVLFHENRHLISVIHAESAYNDRLRKAMYEQVFNPMRCIIEKFVAWGVARGHFRPLSPAAAARSIGSSVLFTFLDVWYQNTELSGPALETIENEFVDLILHGIKKESP